VSSVLENGTLTIWTGRDDTDIGWVVDGNDDTSCENDLLPAKKVSLAWHSPKTFDTTQKNPSETLQNI